MKNQRRIAVDLLNKYKNENSSIESLMDEVKNLNRQEYGFIKTLVYGVIRYEIQLDYIIKQLSKIKFTDLDREIVNILRMSLYQLIYMDHIPQRAVVNEAVNLVKNSANKKAQGFVNGSLRNFIRNKNRYLKIQEKDQWKNLSIKYSMPVWLVKEVASAYGEINLEKTLKVFNEEQDLSIRITKDLEITRDSLNILGFQLLPSPQGENSFTIKNPQGLFMTKDYYQGNFYVQSLSSQELAYQLIKFGSYDNVLDLCAAPGGKIIHLMNSQKNQGNFLACDISNDKLKLIEENKSRLGLENLKIEKNDATVFREDFVDSYDLVIADVPCSALGLMRKLPEVKYNKSIESIEALVDIQKRILGNAKEYVKESGLIAYSTCTFTKRENEELIDEFLRENYNFKLIHRQKISPLDFNSDGFSINILKRID